MSYVGHNALYSPSVFTSSFLFRRKKPRNRKPYGKRGDKEGTPAKEGYYTFYCHIPIYYHIYYIYVFCNSCRDMIKYKTKI